MRFNAPSASAFLLVSCLLLMNTAAFGDEPFTLVRDGEAACTIVTAATPTPSARLAALELQCHVLKMTGVELPVHPGDEAVTGPRILVGDSAAAAALGFTGARLAPQEYVIAFRPDTLILLGQDWEDNEFNRAEDGRAITGETVAGARHVIDYWSTVGFAERSIGEMALPGLYDAQGTCYAVYDFLERFCGVRWYGPAALTQFIPAVRDLRAAGPDICRAPALKHRGAVTRGSWPFLRGQWGDYTDPEVVLFWRRMRLGGEKWSANHTIHRQTVKDLLNDPAYQAHGPAKGLNLCYTNPALVMRMAELARDYFDRRTPLPEGFKAMGDYFAIVPEDVGQFCRCKDCRSLLREGRGRQTGFFSSGIVSDYWFSFINAVAREVAKTHPDKFIATLAYWGYAFPPKNFPLEPNVSIAPCLHTCHFAHNPATRENDMAFYKPWLAQSTAPVFLWVYHHHPMEPALINNWKCFPHVTIHETARAMRMFIADGVRGIFQCGEQDQLEQYLMMKVWDDPALDADALIAEFFKLNFGAAAAPMQAFYTRLEDIASDPANYPEGVKWPSEEISWEYLGTPARMEELGALIAEAEQSAATEAEQRRVTLWKVALWDWMVSGQEAYAGKVQALAPAATGADSRAAGILVSTSIVSVHE
jgi:hypothetical protein